ncbi:arginase family protein [Amycolatopsis suaedae]|uniref:Arginase family protein n=1 Tax=Amycolatopsis suaedae TaxID=2510978 RepID=A0A4Q7JBQ0_9PSEU|nr:arginase family protein [Amycolatopsis suaedae]RZQ64717.1 arginase family protein [Amycolatopsis suaedae]
MRIHVVPQTQGALTPHAGKLADGARALGALTAAVFGVPAQEMPVQSGGSSTVDGIANREVLVANRTAQLAALEAPEGPVLTVGGDCGVDVVPVAVARFRHGADLRVAWFDAHADLNTPESSPSGAFHGMALRALVGEGDPEFAAAPAISGPVLLGARAFDPAEREAVDRGLATVAPVSSAAEVLAPGPCYVHLDLDVLDPAEFAGMDYPEPGGCTVAELAEALRSLRGREVVGGAITECVTADEAELRRLLPVLEAFADLFPES